MEMGYGIGEVAKASEGRIYQLDIVTNNLANTGTTGFKAERYHQGTISVGAGDKERTTPKPPFTIVDYGQGTILRTDNALDVAIQGDGFFTVQTRDGLAYTRKGNFTINKNNQLVTQSGEFLMGNQGPITVAGMDVNIDNVGNVSVNGEIAGELKIVRFENQQALTRTKDGLFTDPGTAGMKKMDNPEIKPRQLEMSNVNSIREMVDMIDIQRSFETYQKVIQTMADLDKLATSRVGKLA
jgi:flagellar basal-body rod protein FlgF